MRRRVISVASVVLAVVALGVVLYNATLVDRRPPSVAGVSLSAPVDGRDELGQTLTAIDVQFSEPVDRASVQRRFRIIPYVAGTFSWDGATAIFTPSEKLPADTEFTITIAPGFRDLAGNVAAAGLEAWTFRTIGPPTVLEAEPADGTDGVPVDAALTLRFDRLMDTESVENALRIEPSAGLRPAWSGAELTITFERPLLFGTTYRLSLATIAADTDGSRLREPFETRFTTVDAGLRVDAVVPAAGVAGVSIRSPIAVVFDGPIDPDSAAAALRVTPAVDGEVRVVTLPSDDGPRPDPASPEPDGHVLLFTPSAPLAAHTTYTVTLDPIVRRLGSEQVAADRTWSFTTGQPTPSGQNQVAFLTARAGVRNIWLMNPDGSNPRQLTVDLAPVSGFDASGDGSLVAWSAAGRVTVMRIDGSEASVLTAQDRFEYAPRFAPDGRHLILGRRDADGADLGYWLVPLPGVLDSGERQLLPAGAPPLGSVALAGEGIGPEGTPAWAPRVAFEPDGDAVLLVAAGGDAHLIDLAERDEPPADRPIGLVASGAPAWSPVDRRFALVASVGGRDDTTVWAIAPDGTTERHEPAIGSIAASSDGWLAFLVRDGAGATHVAVRPVRPDAEAKPLTDGSAFHDRWPSFSPDGTSLLFGRIPDVAQDRSAGIWLADLSSGQVTPLSTDGAFARWLP